MSRSLLAVACLTIGVVSLAGTAPVRAQGVGHGPPPVAPGQSKKAPTAPSTPSPTGPSATTTTPGTSTTGPSASSPRGSAGPATNVSGATPLTAAQAATGNRLQTFGTWLDNTDVNAPRETWVSVSTAYWRSPSLREVDAPAVGVTAGVTPRIQLGFTIPYYFVTAQTGETSRGLGAAYVTSKIGVSQRHAVHVSVSPALEVLSWSVTNSTVHRVNLVLPVSLQAVAHAVRLYGSGGYFSRGSVFGSGAVDWPLNPRVSLMATVAHSYSIASDTESDVLGITRHRTDGGGGIYVRAVPTVMIFASAGRTWAPMNNTSGRLSLVGGVAINVAGPSTHAPRGQ